MKKKILINTSLSILEINKNHLNEKKVVIDKINKCFPSIENEENQFFDYFLEIFFYKSLSIKSFEKFSYLEIKSLAIYSIYLTKDYILKKSLQK